MAGKRMRGHNEGSIYQRKDGKWVGAINLGIQNGKLKRKCHVAKTRKEISDWLAPELAKFKEGLPVVTGRQTVAQFLDRWLIDCVRPTVRPGTFASYEQQLKTHIIPALGGLQLSKLAPQHFQKYMNDKMAERKTDGGTKPGLSAKTVAYQRAILRMALGQAVKWGLASRNAAADCKPPRVLRYEIKPIDQDQARAFLEAAKGDRLEAFFTVALALGLRRGEALGLRWQDVDFQARTLRVTQSLSRLKKKLVLSEPKTKSSRRIIDLSDGLVAKLREHRTRQLEEKIGMGEKWTDTGLVFTTRLGMPIDPRNMKRRLDSILDKANLPHFRIHDLRHFCASLLLAQGVPLKVVSDMLGHSQIGITADLYTHVLPSLRRDAVNLMDSILTAQGIGK